MIKVEVLVLLYWSHGTQQQRGIRPPSGAGEAGKESKSTYSRDEATGANVRTQPLPYSCAFPEYAKDTGEDVKLAGCLVRQVYEMGGVIAYGGMIRIEES